jgi:hypothetical protein
MGRKRRKTGKSQKGTGTAVEEWKFRLKLPLELGSQGAVTSLGGGRREGGGVGINVNGLGNTALSLGKKNKLCSFTKINSRLNTD